MWSTPEQMVELVKSYFCPKKHRGKQFTNYFFRRSCWQSEILIPSWVSQLFFLCMAIGIPSCTLTGIAKKLSEVLLLLHMTDSDTTRNKEFSGDFFILHKFVFCTVLSM